MGFEQYLGQSDRHRRLGKPAVTIGSQGIICLNSTLGQQLPEHLRFCKLFFNKTTGAIAIRLCESNGPGVYPIGAANKENGRRHLHIRGFLRHYKIDTSVTKQYLAKYDPENYTIYVQVRSGQAPKSGSKTHSVVSPCEQSVAGSG